MLERCPKVVGAKSAAAWFIICVAVALRASTHRVAKSHVGRPAKLIVDMLGEYPLFNIPAEHQKNFKDQLLPIAPEFVEFLSETPVTDRTGFVFNPPSISGRKRIGRQGAIKVISDIGKAAGVKVHEDANSRKVKYASAHDLRRAFGERWAPRVMPTTLQLMMRHESIETTLRFLRGPKCPNGGQSHLAGIRKPVW